MKVVSFLKVCITLVFIFGSVCMDLNRGKIANGWILAGLLTSLLIHIPEASPEMWRSAAAGMFLPLVIGWIPFRMRALGAGDIKLFMLTGFLNGGREVCMILLFSFLFAAGISLGRLLSLRQLLQSLNHFYHYFQSVLIQKKIQVYPGRYQKGHTIHFSMAVFLGYAAWLGVKICKNILCL